MTEGSIPDSRLLSLAREARARAEEILARAETFSDAEARRTMLDIADGYEKLAKRLEKAAGDKGEA